MNADIEKKSAVNLVDALEQTGHLWWFENVMQGQNGDDLQHPEYVEALVGQLNHSVVVWANTDNALRPFTNRESVRQAVADYAARYHNVDVDGRSKKLPKNRAQTVQAVKDE